jgi:hypothetical protein
VIAGRVAGRFRRLVLCSVIFGPTHAMETEMDASIRVGVVVGAVVAA